jgi:hypothetical protein
MKLVKKFVIAVLFVSALAINTSAGDLDTPGFVPPPPPPNHSLMASEPTSDENSPNEAYSAADQLFYESLMAILSVF